MLATLSVFGRARPTALGAAIAVRSLFASCAAQMHTRNDGVSKEDTDVRILITGACGQIGTELSGLLREKYGRKNVIATDIFRPSREFARSGPFHYANVTKYHALEELVVEHDIDWVVHNSGILSARGEQNPELAFDVNINGVKNVMELARIHKLRVFAPSSIAAFGTSTPRDQTPDLTVQRPTTIYGVSKVFCELLGEYYHKRYGVDFRSLRYPGVISSKTLPGGGTTDYAVDIFYHALQTGEYTCFLKKDSALPMMYMSDCLRATVQFLSADEASLSQRTYNVTAMSFTPEELAEEIRRCGYEDLKVNYAPDFRQSIADSWPASLDDSAARRDWNWRPEFDLPSMTADMLAELRKKLDIQ